MASNILHIFHSDSIFYESPRGNLIILSTWIIRHIVILFTCKTSFIDYTKNHWKLHWTIGIQGLILVISKLNSRSCMLFWFWFLIFALTSNCILNSVNSKPYLWIDIERSNMLDNVIDNPKQDIRVSVVSFSMSCIITRT